MRSKKYKMKNCPNCNSEVEDNFDLCWNCNFSFSDNKIIDFEDTEIEKTNKKIDCLRCTYTTAQHFGIGERRIYKSRQVHKWEHFASRICCIMPSVQGIYTSNSLAWLSGLSITSSIIAGISTVSPAFISIT